MNSFEKLEALMAERKTVLNQIEDGQRVLEEIEAKIEELFSKKSPKLVAIQPTFKPVAKPAKRKYKKKKSYLSKRDRDKIDVYRLK